MNTLTELKQTMHAAAAAADVSSRDRRAFINVLLERAKEMADKDRWLSIRDEYDRDLVCDAYLEAKRHFEEFWSIAKEFTVRPWYAEESDDLHRAMNPYAELYIAAREYGLDQPDPTPA